MPEERFGSDAELSKLELHQVEDQKRANPSEQIDFLLEEIGPKPAWTWNQMVLVRIVLVV